MGSPRKDKHVPSSERRLSLADRNLGSKSKCGWLQNNSKRYTNEKPSAVGAHLLSQRGECQDDDRASFAAREDPRADRLLKSVCKAGTDSCFFVFNMQSRKSDFRRCKSMFHGGNILPFSTSCFPRSCLLPLINVENCILISTLRVGRHACFIILKCLWIGCA